MSTSITTSGLHQQYPKCAKILLSKLNMATLKQNLCYSIRTMEERDIPQSLELDREAFPTQWPHPNYTSLKQELRNRLAHYIVACKQTDAEPLEGEGKEAQRTFWDKLKHLFIDNDSPHALSLPPRDCIIGIAGFWLMMGEAHIITIAVRETYRRLGVGERLLISLIDLALQLKAHVVTLEVRTSNELAQTLYQKYGFFKTGVRRQYYTDNGEDAFIMTTDSLTSAAFQSQYQRLKKAYEQKWNCTLSGGPL